MPLREFTDTSGRRWQAWNTVPGSDVVVPVGRAGTTVTPSGAHVSPGLELGWLTFQAGDDKRRLSPIPPGWTTASDREMTEYLADAVPVHLSAAAARLLGRAAVE